MSLTKLHLLQLLLILGGKLLLFLTCALIVRIIFLRINKTNNNLSLWMCYEICCGWLHVHSRKGEGKEMYTPEMPLPLELIKSKP